MSHFGSFGCKVLVLDKNPNKGKFDSRAHKGIFVGYSDTSRGYRIWLPKTRKTIIARDVKFLEGSNPVNYEDFVHDDTVNGRGNLLEGADTSQNEIEIASTQITNHPSHDSNEEATESRTPHQQIREDDNVDQCESHARGPGRPRKILTGKPDCPFKLYQIKNQMPNNPANADEDSDEEPERTIRNGLSRNLQ